MSNVIAFLEMIGQNANLRHASRDQMEQALATAQIAPDMQAAILEHDQEQLQALVGASNTCCLLIPGQVSCLLIPSINDEDEQYELRA
jgi:hypothetical protein